MLVNAEVGRVPFLCARIADTASGMGKSHLCFPSDAHPLCRVASRFVIKRRAADESEEEASQNAAQQWDVLPVDFHAGEHSQVTLEFAGGCPVRFQVGGFRGSRSLGMAPQPASWSLWSSLSDVPRAQCGVSFGVLGTVLDARQQVAERPQASSGVLASSQKESYAVMARPYADEAHKLVRETE